MILLISMICVLLSFILIIRQKKAFLHLEHIPWQIYILSTLQAFVLSIQLGRLFWSFFLKFPQNYSELVTGNIGFAYQNKSAEYFAIYAIIISFTVFLIGILFINGRYPENQEFKNCALRNSVYGLIPSFVMLGQSLRILNTKYLLLLSTCFILLSLIVNLILLILNKKNLIKPEETKNIGVKLMLIPIFLVLSEVGVRVFLTRLNLSSYKYGTLIFAVGILYILIIIGKKRLTTYSNKLNLGVFISQLAVPLLFFILLAPPAVLIDGTISIIPFKPPLLFLVLGLVIFSIIDIYKRFLYEEKAPAVQWQCVSPWALVALLVLLQSGTIGWPGISIDEYHSSEFYSPWWLFDHFGYLPYVDFEPARGLINYVPGFLAWLFYDNTFAAQNLINNQFAALYVFGAFFTFRSVVGDLVSFLMVGSFFFFAGVPTGGVILSIVSLVIFYKSINRKNYIKSLWIWLILSSINALIYVAEGSSFVIGTLPIAFWLLYRSYRQSRKNVWISVGAFGLIIGILSLTTKVGIIVLSAARYLIEQSGVNDVAHGIAWQFPISGINEMVTSGYLWQFIRFSWILLLIPIVVFLIRNRNDEKSRTNQLFLVSLFIMCIILIPRGAGRIDASAFSRPGYVSVGVIMCGLPLVLLPNINKPSVLAILPLCFALVFGLLGIQESQISNAINLPLQSIWEPNYTINGKSLGLLNIGTKVAINEDQLRRQLEIKTVLDQILDPQETYYDATNHSADYGIQGRPSPVASLAPYNIPSESQQLRVVDQLEEKQIPLALIQAENINHDGGTLSMRNFTIYNYLLSKYIPFIDEFGRVWMVRDGQEYRLGGTNLQIGNAQERLALLTQTFFQKDIAGIPSSWGNSITNLSDKLMNPQNILVEDNIMGVNDIKLLPDGRWETIGLDPYIVLEIPQNATGDLVYLEFDRIVTGEYMQIFWNADDNPEFTEDQSMLFSTASSKYLIPVSAAPSWKEANLIKKIRIDLPNGFKGNIALTRVIIYDRFAPNKRERR